MLSVGECEGWQKHALPAPHPSTTLLLHASVRQPKHNETRRLEPCASTEIRTAHVSLAIAARETSDSVGLAGAGFESTMCLRVLHGALSTALPPTSTMCPTYSQHGRNAHSRLHQPPELSSRQQLLAELTSRRSGSLPAQQIQTPTLPLQAGRVRA